MKKYIYSSQDTRARANEWNEKWNNFVLICACDSRFVDVFFLSFRLFFVHSFFSAHRRQDHCIMISFMGFCLTIAYSRRRQQQRRRRLIKINEVESVISNTFLFSQKAIAMASRTATILRKHSHIHTLSCAKLREWRRNRFAEKTSSKWNECVASYNVRHVSMLNGRIWCIFSMKT